MSVLEKLLGAVKLNDDSDDDDDYYDDDIIEDEEYLDDEDSGSEEKTKKKFFEKFGKGSRKEDSLDDFDDDILEKTNTKTSSQRSNKEQTISSSRYSQSNPKITPMRGTRKSPAAGNASVCLMKPNTMDEAKDIANTLLSGAIVVLNLEGIDVELAQRLFDFTYGSCYSIGGDFKMVSRYIFVFAPAGVEITESIEKMIEESVPDVKIRF